MSQTQTCVRESVHPAYTRFGRMRNYQHPILLNKIQMELGITRAEAEILFEDVKRFLALCVTTPQPLAPTKTLDQGWHTFILFTKEYGQFCKDYCGRYVHHQPEDPFAEAKDYDSIPRTRELARVVFGDLSLNWQGPSGKTEAADCCPSGCQGKDCSPGDCTSCKTCSHS
ncbi:MAG: glycine-rich domain-containing protein [Minisyncoccota bacterium]